MTKPIFQDSPLRTDYFIFDIMNIQHNYFSRITIYENYMLHYTILGSFNRNTYICNASIFDTMKLTLFSSRMHLKLIKLNFPLQELFVIHTCMYIHTNVSGNAYMCMCAPNISFFHFYNVFLQHLFFRTTTTTKKEFDF